MAVSGKRLFWVSIIIVELVLVYVAWRPVREHFRRQSHRIAAAPRPQRRPETSPSPAETSPPAAVAKSISPAPKVASPAAVANNASPAVKKSVPSATQAKPSTVVIATAKPSPIPRPRPRARNLGPVVNAGLRTPEPITAKPALSSPAPAGPLDSFWCRLSQAESDCDCKNKGEEQAANHVMR